MTGGFLSGDTVCIYFKEHVSSIGIRHAGDRNLEFCSYLGKNEMGNEQCLACGEQMVSACFLVVNFFVDKESGIITTL